MTDFLRAHPPVIVAAVIAFAIIGIVGYWIVTRKAPQVRSPTQPQRRPAAARMPRRRALPYRQGD